METVSRLIIRNVPHGANRQDILRTFIGFGGITWLELDPVQRQALISFANTDVFPTILAQNPHYLNGASINAAIVECKQPRLVKFISCTS